MISAKTVFVVGAGASCELKLPTGETLKPVIANALQTRPESSREVFVDEAVELSIRQIAMSGPQREAITRLNELAKAANQIRRAMHFALSIDRYLDSQIGNDDIVQLGKIGIARAILLAEQASALGSNFSPRLQKSITVLDDQAKRAWHLKLCQLMLDSGAPEELSFIVFNYDRCLETYLYKAIMNYRGLSSQEAAKIMEGINIIHPYGQVGLLPWQGGEVPFGYDKGEHLLDIARGIKTFTESAESGTIDRVRETLEGAETVVFMGYGFLPQNNALLKVNQKSAAKRVFFTTYGISSTDLPIVQDSVRTILQKQPMRAGIERDDRYHEFVERGGCSDLMNNNWLRLTRPV